MEMEMAGEDGVLYVDVRKRSDVLDACREIRNGNFDQVRVKFRHSPTGLYVPWQVIAMSNFSSSRERWRWSWNHHQYRRLAAHFRYHPSLADSASDVSSPLRLAFSFCSMRRRGNEFRRNASNAVP
ncbi:hypothetical protein RIF29_18613 [Crotalaria pallida]|uniref:Uncharacterized protein n=1 Tax=Crotalaria pallida TaxID=3830 RepID=A0AAN9IAL3_CROPI